MTEHQPRTYRRWEESTRGIPDTARLAVGIEAPTDPGVLTCG